MSSKNSSEKEETNSESEVTPHSLITQDLVEAALRADKGPDVQLGPWRVEDFTKAGDNYACVVCSVLFDFTEHGKKYQSNYIVKLNPCRGTSSFNVFDEVMFKKEGLFYRDVIPELNRCLQGTGMGSLSVPKLIYVHLEPKREVVFLEDMRPQGFRMFDRKKGQDSAHAKLIIKELAKLHSASVLLQKQNHKTPLIEKFPFLEDLWSNPVLLALEAFHEMMLHTLQGARVIAESIPNYNHVVKWIDDLSSKLLYVVRDLVASVSPSFVAIGHGDCWTNNQLFRYDTEGQPTEAVLLDLQLSRICDLGCDLNHYLYTSFDGEERNINTENYLDTYYDYFSAVFQAARVDVPFTRCELRENYEKHNHLGAIFGLICTPIILADSEDVTNMPMLNSKDFDKNLEAFGKLSLKSTEKNPIVKSRFLSIFDDLIKQGRIPPE